MSDYKKITDNLIQEFRRGILVYIVLLNCKKSVYGYSLVGKIEETGIPIEKNTLYPLLRRLEKQKLLSSEWSVDESRPRKYYQISEFGERVLETLSKEWVDLIKKINLIEEEIK
ncbi:PadR family transcriptional regulator [Mycoplasmatota bacterium]|nr:PadR family transcriptional regulator [Mycoplasmatota bacterium]